MRELRRLEVGAAALDFFPGHLKVDPAIRQIHLHQVAGFEDRQIAPGRGFGRGVEDRRTVRRPALPSVSHARQHPETALDERIGRGHVHDFGGARIRDRSCATNDKHAGFIDVQRRIVDAAAIVFRTVEDDDARDETFLRTRRERKAKEPAGVARGGKYEDTAA